MIPTVHNLVLDKIRWEMGVALIEGYRSCRLQDAGSRLFCSVRARKVHVLHTYITTIFLFAKDAGIA